MGQDDWIEACQTGAIEAEGVVRFDWGTQTFAIYRTEDDRYFATEGLCTHERVHLADGLVIGTAIECPKHNGTFDFTNGQPLGPPVCVDLKTYPTKVVDGKVFINLG